MIEVEIVGGPRDGAHIALPDGTRELRVPYLMNPCDFLYDDPHPDRPLDIRAVDMDIVHYPWGNYAYWREPC